MNPARYMLLVATCALLLAACGGSDESGSSGDEGGSTESTTSTPAGSGDAGALDAKGLFASTCGVCHALSDAGTNGAVGPNLDETSLDAAGIESQIENGGGGMPAGLLDGADRTAVAAYVAEQAGNG